MAGGPAEELERRIQESFRTGIEHVVIDLRGVPTVDSAGVRALVRGHTSAQRLRRRFTLVAPNPRVRELFQLSHLAGVMEVADSLVDARTRAIAWDRVLAGAGVLAVGLSLVFIGMYWPGFAPESGSGGATGIPGVSAGEAPGTLHPLYELVKLIAAAVIGMLVTVVHRQYRTERSANPALDQAQVLLCIAGAMVMIIIGNSVARAFGIAGAASIIRFRTPVEDARDITILFLLMGLGMAAGLGSLAVAGLGTVFLCVMIPLLNQFSSARPRTMLVEIMAEGREFPTSRVYQVFAVNGIVFEPREVSQGDEATVRYLTTLKATDSLEELSAQFIGDGKQGVKNVSWSAPKKG